MELLNYKCPKCLLVSPLGASYDLIACPCGQSLFDPLSHVYLGARIAVGPSTGVRLVRATGLYGALFLRSKYAVACAFIIFASLFAYPVYKFGASLYTASLPKQAATITISGLAFTDAGAGNYLFSASINNPSGQDIDWPNIKVELTKLGQVVLTKVIPSDEYLHSSISLEVADPQGKVVYQPLTTPQDLLKLRNGRYLLRLSLNLPGAQAAEADNYRLSLEPHQAKN